ncbi:MAG TPA: enoyl-CoA hydratase/isomerase family protein [Burkholderiaceae bacterium]|jgi:enoyl-CoA hydratase/carnithine racemase|nr:enoyl-CoA hydratase/isomerase family protein [Burkholderiaceae bacterium]
MKPVSESPPTLSRDGAVATLRLNRPGRRNSLRDEDLRTLLALIGEVNDDTRIRVLVLTGQTHGQRRPVFCAGYDVGGFDDDASASQGGSGRLPFEQVPDALEVARPVTVCALNGSVYGGATDLVLACDLRVALAGSEWRMPAAALGLHYYPSGLRRYVSRLGVNLAQRLFLTGQAMGVETIDARAALFAAVAPADTFDAAVDEIVHAAAALAPLAAESTKQSLHEMAAGQFHWAALREREALTTASADFAEGRAAMAAKRPPVFTRR